MLTERYEDRFFTVRELLGAALVGVTVVAPSVLIIIFV